MDYINTNDHPALDESAVQQLIQKWCSNKNHIASIPNCTSLFGYEADVGSITQTMLGHMFEIKVSRSDWLAELRQVRSKDDQWNCKRGRAEQLSNIAEVSRKIADDNVQITSRGGNCQSSVPPSYFWVVAPDGVVKDGELPEYAGLMIVSQGAAGRYLRCEVEAPRLHRVKIIDKQLLAITRGLNIRYWNQRRSA